MSKLCPKVILEGTRLSGKTDLAFALNEHPKLVGARKYRYHSPVISAEWCGFSNQPWGRGLINYEPEERDRAMETYATWMRLFELLRYYSWIIDRFHLSTRAWQIGHGREDPDFGWLEERLAAVGFRIVLCLRRPETFEAARAERLKVSGNPSQYDDLQPFIDEQALLQRLAADSRLPVLELDVSGGDVARSADEVAGWLESSGGLYADY
ncbi:MAG: hypothetical protein P8102_09180 [Gammaproteobacteria bacterium]